MPITTIKGMAGTIDSRNHYSLLQGIRTMNAVTIAIRSLLSIRAEFAPASAYWQAYWNELFLSCLLSAETDTTYIPPVCGAGDYHRQNFADMSPFFDYLFPIPHVKTFDHAGDKRSKQTMLENASKWYAAVGRNRRGNVEIDKVEVKAPYLKKGKVSVRRNRLKTISNCRRQLRNGENYPIAYVGNQSSEVLGCYIAFGTMLAVSAQRIEEQLLTLGAVELEAHDAENAGKSRYVDYGFTRQDSAKALKILSKGHGGNGTLASVTRQSQANQRRLSE